MRRSSLFVDERRPLSRNVGFEVGGDGSLVGYQTRLMTPDSFTSSLSSKNEKGRYFSRVEGFNRSNEGAEVNSKGEVQDLQETWRDSGRRK
ncbi:hypothetical protein Mapa_002117 [Marchantia paleacea]|nr:hypothetical protein Mapa_002117 [Marchantia paleacea]